MKIYSSSWVYKFLHYFLETLKQMKIRQPLNKLSFKLNRFSIQFHMNRMQKATKPRGLLGIKIMYTVTKPLMHVLFDVAKSCRHYQQWYIFDTKVTRLAFFWIVRKQIFKVTASKHFAPPVHILKTSKHDPEEKPV